MTYRQLIDESGLKSHLHEFTDPAIAEFLETRPDLVDACILACENIRGSGTWFFSESNPGEFEVGYYTNDLRFEGVQLFQRRTLACADYLHRHLLSMLD